MKREDMEDLAVRVLCGIVLAGALTAMCYVMSHRVNSPNFTDWDLILLLSAMQQMQY